MYRCKIMELDEIIAVKREIGTHFDRFNFSIDDFEKVLDWISTLSDSEFREFSKFSGAYNFMMRSSNCYRGAKRAFDVMRSNGVQSVATKDLDDLKKWFNQLVLAYKEDTVKLFTQANTTYLFYTYISQFGLYKPVDVAELYRVGGMNEKLAEEAEYYFGNCRCCSGDNRGIVKIPADLSFASNTEDLPTQISPEQYDDLLLPRNMTLSDTVYNKIGRTKNSPACSKRFWEENVDKIIREVPDYEKLRDKLVEYYVIGRVPDSVPAEYKSLFGRAILKLADSCF